MKFKLMLFALVPSLMASPALAIDLDVDLYGEVNLAYDFNDPADDDWTSYTSKLGVKGKHALNDALTVVYQVEQEVDVAHGGTDIDTLLSTRNTYIGLEGSFGTVLFGAYDTPLKKAQGKVDLFNDQSGDIKTLVVGEVRAKDSWAYHSPEWSGVSLQAMYIPSDSKFDSSKSLAVLMDRDDWSFGFGVDFDMRKNDRTAAKTAVYDSYRASAQYTPGDWKFGLLAERSEQQNLAGADAETAFVVNASYQLNNVTFMVQHGKSDIVGSDVTGSNAGVHYNFSKQTKVYLYYWDFDDGSDTDTVSLGLEHKF